MKQFMIYELYEDETAEKPFYVGWADTSKPHYRPDAHLLEAKKFLRKKLNNKEIKRGKFNIAKNELIANLLIDGKSYIVKEVFSSNCPNKAFQEERRLIEHYGRLCNETGCLTNVRAGGTGNNSRRKVLQEHNKEMQNLQEQFGKMMYEHMTNEGMLPNFDDYFKHLFQTIQTHK